MAYFSSFCHFTLANKPLTITLWSLGHVKIFLVAHSSGDDILSQTVQITIEPMPILDCSLSVAICFSCIVPRPLFSQCLLSSVLVVSRRLIAWYSGRTLVFDPRTFPDLRSTYS